MDNFKEGLEIFKIWAPDDALWTQWAKPVLFMNAPVLSSRGIDKFEVNWIQNLDRHTMIILDLPGCNGVLEALALAKLGYRPVPLYNGVNAQFSSMMISVSEIVSALFKGAKELSQLYIQPDAPPVFMLDSNRMNGLARQRGKYDNRWCVFPQDMPSAAFLVKEGIHTIIVHTESIKNDLAHILHRYQDEDIGIYHCREEQIKRIPIVKPSEYKSLSYRFSAILGLTRNYAGGFGGWIPEQTQTTTTGTRFYGYG